MKSLVWNEKRKFYHFSRIEFIEIVWVQKCQKEMFERREYNVNVHRVHKTNFFVIVLVSSIMGQALILSIFRAVILSVPFLTPIWSARFRFFLNQKLFAFYWASLSREHRKKNSFPRVNRNGSEQYFDKRYRYFQVVAIQLEEKKIIFSKSTTFDAIPKPHTIAALLLAANFKKTHF